LESESPVISTEQDTWQSPGTEIVPGLLQEKEILKKGCKADHTTHAKELKKDLIVDAMREVTNMSSRMAIDSHRKRFSGCNEYSLNSNIGSQNPRSATTSEKSRRWY